MNHGAEVEMLLSDEEDTVNMRERVPTKETEIAWSPRKITRKKKTLEVLLNVEPLA